MPNEMPSISASIPWRSRSARLSPTKRVGLRETTWQHVGAAGQHRVWSHAAKTLSIRSLDYPVIFLDATDFPHDSLLRRLVDLKNAADEMGWELNATSESLLYEFINAASVTHLPVLTLRPGGTLRAVWEAGNNEQIGLHIRSEGEFDYVLFSRDSQGEVGRHFGTSDRDHVLAIVHALGLDYLLRP